MQYARLLWEERTGCLLTLPRGQMQAQPYIYTMVEMAKVHGLNIYKYLNYLLERLPGTKMSDNALSKLAPWEPEVIAICAGAM